ncbi:MAG TPA: AAA family ATPase [Pseudobacteroides sp.]|uniref:ATP-binding protein n=1 Tax=Pseudobacteroides sp. TaxID=1968840 RepID=UPI002F958B07
MKIKRLELTAFGKFKNHIVEFDEGLNLIFGENEAGKTTLQNFIKYMLYGVKGSKQLKGYDNPKRYKPWKDSGFSGTMEYALDNGPVITVNRNFEDNSVRVYDSFFNDITNTFEMGKNKSVLFAQKHLGINEVCFEKTVFVRQAGALVDVAGLSELKNMLINLAQTGFEDVSFIKAEKALKEAIKKHTGNARSSDMSLDRINARLMELKAAKAGMERERDRLMLLDKELKEQHAHLEMLKSAMNGIYDTRSYLKLRRDLKTAKARENDLKDILSRIKTLEAEKALLQRNTEGADAGESTYSTLRMLSIDELEELINDCRCYLDYGEELKIQKERFCKKKGELEEAESSIDRIAAFKHLGSNVDEEMLELNIKVDNIKKQINNIRGESFFESSVKNGLSLYNRKKSLGVYGVAIILCIILAVLFTGGFFINPLLLVGGPVFSAIAIVLYVMKHNHQKVDLPELEKKESNPLEAEMNKLEERIESILLTVKVASIEEFFRLHALYKSSVIYFNDLNNDLCMLEGKLISIEKQQNASWNNIQEKLYRAGIDIAQEYINTEFFNIVKNVYSKKMSQNSDRQYRESRKADILLEHEKCIEKAAQITGSTSIMRPDDVYNELNRITQNVSIIEKDCALYEEKGVSILSSEASLNDLDESLDKSQKTHEQELQETLLRIKEIETILKNSLKDEELQRTVEEINELETRKDDLESLLYSLKTAHETLNEASVEIHRDFVPALNDKTGYILRKMTGNKYEKLKLDDNLVIRLVEPQTGAVISLDMLSYGTVEQVYLALRIAASELLMGETLPLMLDEVFSFYDDKRIAGTLEMLKGISAGRQIILFTCKEWEMDKICQMCQSGINVIKL